MFPGASDFMTRKRKFALGACVLWLSACICGFMFLANFQSQPGKVAKAGSVFPAESDLGRPLEKPTLFAFLHPGCACSRASLSELLKVSTRLQGKFNTEFVVRPLGTQADFSNLLNELREFPSSTIHVDYSGAETQRFGVFTSGQILVYDTNQALLFSGGITGGRGHAGDNPAEESLVRQILDRSGEVHTPVFGCHLRSPRELLPS